jgi:hypothetical protein
VYPGLEISNVKRMPHIDRQIVGFTLGQVQLKRSIRGQTTLLLTIKKIVVCPLFRWSVPYSVDLVDDSHEHHQRRT